MGGGFSNNSPGSKDKQGGGNPVRWTPTPSWQKGISNFFQKRDDGSTSEKSSESKSDPASSTESTTQQEPSSDITSLDE